MTITRISYSVVYLFHPSYIPRNNTGDSQYLANSIINNTLILSYYLDQEVIVNTTPGNSVNVLPGNTICIYRRSGNVYSKLRAFELSDTSITI